ncbi:MAG: hypothetical protein R3F14_02555 [Polyangiaceae bacterium]
MSEARQTGLAIPPRDPDALAAGILRLHADPELAKRVVAGANELFESEFSIEASGRAYEKLYVELLEKAGIHVPPAAPERRVDPLPQPAPEPRPPIDVRDRKRAPSRRRAPSSSATSRTASPADRRASSRRSCAPASTASIRGSSSPARAPSRRSAAPKGSA